MHSVYLARDIVYGPIARLKRETARGAFASPTTTSSYVGDAAKWDIGRKHNIFRSLLFFVVSLAGSV